MALAGVLWNAASLYHVRFSGALLVITCPHKYAERCTIPSVHVRRAVRRSKVPPLTLTREFFLPFRLSPRHHTLLRHLLGTVLVRDTIAQYHGIPPTVSFTVTGVASSQHGITVRAWPGPLIALPPSHHPATIAAHQRIRSFRTAGVGSLDSGGPEH